MSLPPVSFWLLHGGGSLLVAALVCALAVLLHRLLRLSDASDRYWRGAWWLAVLPPWLALAVVAVLPDMAAVLPALPDAAGWAPASPDNPIAVAVAAPVSDHLPIVLLLVYLSGLTLAVGRWWRGLRAIRRMLASSRPWPAAERPDDDPGGVTMLQRRGIALRLIDAPLSPFAVDRPRATIVLPASLLDRLDGAQLSLILRHEAAHLARRDPQRAALRRLVGVLLWFNPWLHMLARREQLSIELRCDAAAIEASAGGNRNMRRAYAEAYLETLRMSAGRALACPATAFSPQDQGSHTMRIRHIVHGDPRRGKPHPLLRLALGGLAVVAGGGLTLLQAQAASGDAIAFRSPLAGGSVSSGFGAVAASTTRAHKGVDIVAPRGTPVTAPAAGVVQAATERYGDASAYGTVVVLDHGDGWQTLFAHLDGFDVAVGDRVQAGQPIGRVGSTGKASRPHLHVELRRDGQRVDPASMLPLASGATRGGAAPQG